MLWSSRQKSKNLEISGNIIIAHIPPYTPEGFGNKIFSALNSVVDRLCDTINLYSNPFKIKLLKII